MVRWVGGMGWWNGLEGEGAGGYIMAYVSILKTNPVFFLNYVVATHPGVYFQATIW